MKIFEIADFKFTFLNILDFLIVGILALQLFKLLRGSLAYSILMGILTLYIFWLIATYFEMPLLSGAIGAFGKVGIIGLLIVFQQEIRKFLLLMGKVVFSNENRSLKTLLPWKWKIDESFHTNFEAIVDACFLLAEKGLGAIIVFPKTSEMKFIGSSGEILDSAISKRLLVSIFSKSSPLHDGAVIISKGKIKAANCILPITENPAIQNQYGLRHLSAIGITEQSDAVCLVVSEERRTISFVKEGKVTEKISSEQILEFLNKEFAEQMLSIPIVKN